MAKKKKIFGLPLISSGKKKKKKKTKAQRLAQKQAAIARVKIILSALCVALVIAAIGFGFFYLERYVHKVSPIAQAAGPLVLVDQPDWMSSELVQEIKITAGGENFYLNKQTAETVAANLNDFKWFTGLRIQTMNDSLQVDADYRMPLARITVNGKQYYIDKKLESFKYIPISKLAIPDISGITLKNANDSELQEDIAAAVQLIILLRIMDKDSMEKDENMPPLLNEIDRIDVSNLNGRKSSKDPHIVLYTKDDTPIYWGLQYGKTTGQIEATDTQKLASLYNLFKKNNTLLGRFKKIDLRSPR